MIWGLTMRRGEDEQRLGLQKFSRGNGSAWNLSGRNPQSNLYKQSRVLCENEGANGVYD